MCRCRAPSACDEVMGMGMDMMVWVLKHCVEMAHLALAWALTMALDVYSA